MAVSFRVLCAAMEKGREEGKAPGLCPGAVPCVAPLQAPGSLRISCSAGNSSVLHFFVGETVGEDDLESQPISSFKPYDEEDDEGRSRPFPLGELPAQSPVLSQGGMAAVPGQSCACVCPRPVQSRHCSCSSVLPM